MKRFFIRGLILCLALASAGCGKKEISFESQSLHLTSVNNARELGGYTVGGKTIRHNVLLRSARLSELSSADSTALADRYDIACIFDFRSEAEAEALPDIVPGDAVLVPLPFGFAGSGASSALLRIRSVDSLASAMLRFSDSPELIQMVTTMYDKILFSDVMQDRYHSFFTKLCEIPEGSAVLWHCTQGKDRTGVASALLLAALGADMDLIMKDFALSKEYFDPFIAKMGDLTENQTLVLNTFISANPDVFKASLDKVCSEYGSLDGYLERCIGVTPEMKNILCAKYLR